ncbi:hypothetical protein [Lederbergia galactosidilytica]|uniref:Uncharacterized protein n=1 Tax=Lederbergia galactosidilytica TaxID=217031 RepID=A0A177ZQ41_9BACI|nr:hypothetical protein [Lederbergia galactosidilytica]OAK70092.1 hypothetical protein ABB05_13000 [Lederbergia galactosidilytica]
MVTNESIEEYIKKMHDKDLFMNLDDEQKDSSIFSALELLKDHYRPSKITDRAVALQVLYMLEGEDEEYAKLKRHGVKNYAVKGVSVTFDGGEIASSVIAILGEPRTKKATVGQLI